LSTNHDAEEFEVLNAYAEMESLRKVCINDSVRLPSDYNINLEELHKSLISNNKLHSDTTIINNRMDIDSSRDTSNTLP
jgi:hypothetical protein